MLKDGLTDGTIDATLRPKDVYKSSKDFMKYPLSSFCSAFNWMKADLGVFVHDDGKLLTNVEHYLVATWLTWYCFDVSSSILEEEFDNNDDIGDDAEDDTSDDKKPSAKKPKLSTTAHCLNVHPSLQWKPQIAMSVWVSEQLHDMVTVAISLTGGVNINDGCKVFVSDNNNDLIVSEKMIDMLEDMNLIHKHGHERTQKPLLLCMQQLWDFTSSFLVSERGKEDDDIYTTAIIPLPFQVQKTIIMMQKMGHKDGARVLYVVLRAVEFNDNKAPAKSELVMTRVNWLW